MAHIAVSYLALVGVQMVLISAQTTFTSTRAMPINTMTNTMTNSTVTTMTSTMTGSTVNLTNTNYTDFHSTEGQYSTSTKLPDVTPAPPDTPPPPSRKTTANSGLRDTTTTAPAASGEGDRVGIIIIVVIIIIALLAALFCLVARSKGRRYSVDLSSRPDEVQIPLSAVEPNPTAVTFVSNGLQFEGTEGSTQEPQEPQELQETQETQETSEPEVKLEDQVEQKVAAEPEKVTADASADCAAPPAETPEDQSTQDVPEQSPAAPVEPSGEEKTDDEGDASNKTSVEPPKESNEANENNSNSTVQPQRGARDGEAFWDTSLDSMV